MADVIWSHLEHNGDEYDLAYSRSIRKLADDLRTLLSAAGFGLVADAKAEALEEAAARFKERSDTLHNTMQEMTASKEYGLEDIVRYGAYSAEANTTATWLRTKASVIRNQS